MKKWILSSFFLLFSAILNANTVSPVGTWKTIDDVTGKPKAIVNVSLNQQHQLQGQIVKVFYEQGKEHHTHCEACPGNKKNQPLVGLIFMEDLTQSHSNPLHWEGGTILDPKTGKVYRCQLDLDDANRIMKVRGYIGFSLLGRTQQWVRVTSKQH